MVRAGFNGSDFFHNAYLLSGVSTLLLCNSFEALLRLDGCQSGELTL